MMTQKMQALVLHGVDEPLRMESVDMPTLQEGEALVRIFAAAFNRRDFWIQKGQYAGLKFPVILGSDGAGIVESVFSSTSEDHEWVGKEVILNPALGWDEDSEVQPEGFSILGLPQNGTFAEYVKVPIKNLYEKPAHLDWSEAAALPLSGVTAYRALFKKADLKAGESVLVTGIGGGAATFALLWAVACGAKVYVTSSSPLKIQKAIDYGAIDGTVYNSSLWPNILEDQAGGFDVIVDSALGDSFFDFLNLAKPGGRIVFFGGTNGNIPDVSGRKIFWKQLQIKGTTMGSAVDFSKMLRMVSEHQIRPIVHQVLKWELAQEGLDSMTHSSQFGKIVIAMR